MRTAIQEAINRAGGRQRLALRLGVTDMTIGNWLRKGRPPLQAAIRLFKIYGIPLEELLIEGEHRHD